MKIKYNKYEKHYSELGFWGKITKYAKEAGIKTIYSALLMFYAFKRKETPKWAKSVIVGALGYFLTPFDVIPDFLPAIGYTDDLGVLTFGLVVVAAYINNDVKEKARLKTQNWFGTYDDAEISDVEDEIK